MCLWFKTWSRRHFQWQVQYTYNHSPELLPLSLALGKECYGTQARCMWLPRVIRFLEWQVIAGWYAIKLYSFYLFTSSAMNWHAVYLYIYHHVSIIDLFIITIKEIAISTSAFYFNVVLYGNLFLANQWYDDHSRKLKVLTGYYKINLILRVPLSVLAP